MVCKLLAITGYSIHINFICIAAYISFLAVNNLLLFFYLLKSFDLRISLYCVRTKLLSQFIMFTLKLVQFALQTDYIGF